MRPPVCLSSIRLCTARLFLVSLLACWLAPAFAHHPMGGVTPVTMWQGILSGAGHPVIGIDHLAFLIGAGLLAASVSRLTISRAVGLAAIFGLAGMAGTLLRVPGVDVPAAELGVSISLALLGMGLLLRRVPDQSILVAIALLAGIAHGYAFGEAVVGAQAAPITGYLIGLLVTQTALLVTAWLGARRLAQAWPNWISLPLRAAGLLTLTMGLIGFVLQAGLFTR